MTLEGRWRWSRAEKLSIVAEIGERAAVIYSPIETARLGGLDPEAYLRDVLARIADHPINRIGEVLPRNWSTTSARLAT